MIIEKNYIEFVSGQKYPTSYSEPVISDDIEAFDSCGIIIPDDVVIVDIDVLDERQIDGLLDFLKPSTPYYRTDRGVHIFYQKAKRMSKSSEHICALGFNVEVKQKNWVTIKLDGKVSRDFVNDGNPLEVFPDYFKPQKTLDNLLGLNDGEGRYNKLVKYALRLKSAPKKREVLEFINEFIFSEKMSTKNFNSILGVKGDDNNLDLDSPYGMMSHMMNVAKPAKYYNNTYWLCDGRFTSDINHINRTILAENPKLMPKDVQSIYEMVDMRCPYYDDYQEWSIKVPNGVLHKGTFIETTDYVEFTPFQLDYPFIPNAEKPEALDKFLKSVTGDDPEYEQYIIDMLAWSLIINPSIRKKHPKMHIIVGDGGNGKGVLLGLFGKILGNKNVTSVKMDELSNESKVVTLRRSLANLGEDIKDKPMDKDIFSRVKNITALDPITLRDLYEKADSNIMVHSNLIFTSNHLIQAFERGKAVERRVVWCPMYGQVAEDLTDEDFEELKSEATYIYLMKEVVFAYLRLYETKEFTHCEKVIEYTKQTLDNEDYVGKYIENIPVQQLVFQKSKTIFEAFDTYCNDEGLDVNITQRKFITEVCKLRGVKSSTIRTGAGNQPTRCIVPDLDTPRGRELNEEVERLKINNDV